jgi:hypothetical protein
VGVHEFPLRPLIRGLDRNLALERRHPARSIAGGTALIGDARQSLQHLPAETAAVLLHPLIECGRPRIEALE